MWLCMIILLKGLLAMTCPLVLNFFFVHIGKFFSPYDEKGSTKSAVVITHLRETTATVCVNRTFLNMLKTQGSHHIMF